MDTSPNSLKKLIKHSKNMMPCKITISNLTENNSKNATRKLRLRKINLKFKNYRAFQFIIGLQVQTC